MPGFIKSRGFRILLVFLLFFAVYKFYVNYQQIKELENRIHLLEKNIVIAEARKIQLEEELKNVNDPDYIERIARDELGLVKPGELLLIPVEEEK